MAILVTVFCVAPWCVFAEDGLNSLSCAMQGCCEVEARNRYIPNMNPHENCNVHSGV